MAFGVYSTSGLDDWLINIAVTPFFLLINKEWSRQVVATYTLTTKEQSWAEKLVKKTRG